jgi:hypothetical protein
VASRNFVLCATVVVLVEGRRPIGDDMLVFQVCALDFCSDLLVFQVCVWITVDRGAITAWPLCRGNC